MKIIFLCGSLEPGRDGVGDYTRRLAGELIRQGYQVKVISLNDNHVPDHFGELQIAEDVQIDTLRLGRKLSWETRISLAKKFIVEFNPEYLSLQFVPFAFQEKGLPFGFAPRMKTLCEGRKWHIMFHELWLGIDLESSYKMKVWGYIQKQLVIHLIRTLKPEQISTQSQTYQAVLSDLGIQSSLLPLFSNIPKIENNINKDSSLLTCILFGGIHQGAPIADFIRDISRYSSSIDKELFFSFIGRNGASALEWTEVLDQKQIKYNIIGECESVDISNYLFRSDLGVSTTPYYLAEKSGTVAAMLDHDLPVICVARNWTPNIQNNIKTKNNILPYQIGKTDFSEIHPNQTTINLNVGNIAINFSKLLV